MIGNGFDKAHRLPTGFNDFRQWLIKEYLNNNDTEKNRLKDILYQKYEFKHIIDNILERTSDMEDEEGVMDQMFDPNILERSEKAQRFLMGVAKEWTDIQEGKIEITGLGKEGMFASLEKAKCNNLLKLFKEMGDAEWNQENMDKAMNDIVEKEYSLKAIQEWESSNFINFNAVDNKKDIDTIMANVIITTIDNATESTEWKDFESALGELNFDLLVEKQIDDTEDYLKSMLYRRILHIALPQIPDFFKNWIDDVNKETSTIIKDEFSKTINKEKDLFLTFNYTNTLESLYGVKNVCHIHGSQTKEIIVGHGKKNVDYYSPFSDEQEVFDSKDAENALLGGLKKITSRCINNHREFFSSLNDVTKIYSIGFSFGDVDLPYIKEICQNINSAKVEWYFTKYNEDKNETKGFKVQIDKVLADLKTEEKIFPEIEYKIFDF